MPDKFVLITATAATVTQRRTRQELITDTDTLITDTDTTLQGRYRYYTTGKQRVTE